MSFNIYEIWQRLSRTQHLKQGITNEINDKIGGWENLFSVIGFTDTLPRRGILFNWNTLWAF